VEKEIFYFSAQKKTYDFKIEIIGVLSSTYSVGVLYFILHILLQYFLS